MRLLPLLLVSLFASCQPCNRDPKFWIPGSILVTFETKVTTTEAAGIVTRLGYAFSSDRWFPNGGTATVPHGEECLAEDRLMAQPGVTSALQDTFVFLTD